MTAGSRAKKAQRALVVAQISTSFVLLIGAGLLVRTLIHLQRVDSGFDGEAVLTMDIPASFAARTVPEIRDYYLAILEDGGDTPFDELPPPPQAAGGMLGDDPYSRRVERLNGEAAAFAETRILTPYEDVPFRVTPRGARSGFLVDRTLGHKTGGLTAVMHQLAPGLYQSRHRHGGEAWLYCVTGEGYSTIDEERVDWKAGDLVVVDHWAWHQHFNASKDKVSSIIRVHNFDTLYFAMGALLAPLNLLQELDKLDAPDVSGVEWPDVDQGRPSA